MDTVNLHVAEAKRQGNGRCLPQVYGECGQKANLNKRTLHEKFLCYVAPEQSFRVVFGKYLDICISTHALALFGQGHYSIDIAR